MAKVKKKEKTIKKEKKEKKKKVPKKEKKEKKEKSTESEEVDTSAATSPLSSNAISSWSAVFSTAAAVKPVALGGYKELIGDDDALGVSSLARECLVRKSINPAEEHPIQTKDASPRDRSSKRRKLEKEDQQLSTEISSNEEASTELQTLEGRMFEFQGESILGLVDVEKNIVYSGVERTESGDMIPIGSIEENGTLSCLKKEFPFQTDPDDHCESPAESYRDIEPVLKALVTSNKDSNQLAIYDPYYCNGSVVRHLSEIGFPNVYNKKEDCYKTWSPQDRTQPYPLFDVFLTNPPYSGNHIPRLINHIFSQDFLNSGKPWLLLMPTFVHKKDYYKDALKKSGIKPFYLVPKKRYIYLPPKNFREKKVSDVHKKSSPFPSMWYIWGGCEAVTESMIRGFQHSNKQNPSCELARSKNALRDLRRKRK